MITVIIPVKNGSSTLNRCLQNLRSQLGVGSLEIIILDSGSTDDSVAIANNHGAIVVSVNPSDFNHGLTRNLGVKIATGSLIFFTVQDAWLSSDLVLKNMVDWFKDSDVAAVCGHQAVPHEKDKNPALWFKRYTEPIPDVHCYRNKLNLPLVPWDNVVAMYRSHELRELPFIETYTGEDMIWASEALRRGYKLIYDPSLVIWHYHHRTFSYVFRNDFALHYTFYKKLSFKPSNYTWINKSISNIIYIFRNKNISMSNKVYWSLHSVISNFASAFTTFLFNFILFYFGEKGLYTSFGIICKVIPQGRQLNK